MKKEIQMDATFFGSSVFYKNFRVSYFRLTIQEEDNATFCLISFRTFCKKKWKRKAKFVRLNIIRIRLVSEEKENGECLQIYLSFL